MSRKCLWNFRLVQVLCRKGGNDLQGNNIINVVSVDGATKLNPIQVADSDEEDNDQSNIKGCTPVFMYLLEAHFCR